MRAAVAQELQQARPRPGDWQDAAQTLERSRLRGDWLARWHLRVFEEAVVAQDVVSARLALSEAERLSSREYPQQNRTLFIMRSRELLQMMAPWLLTTVGALALGTLLDRGSERRRRERRPQVRINPFVTGRPLRDASMVFGRDAILSTVQRGVRENRSYYLTGERRIGKTTILLQVGEQLRRSGGVSVLVDVAATSGDQALAALGRALRTQARLLGLPNDGSASDLLARLSSKGPVVLLVDEVDALNNASRACRSIFRKAALEADSPARMVAAGVGLDFQRDDEARRWGSLAQVIEVGPLTDEAARALLIEPVASSLSWTEAAIKAVQRASQGRPMVVQLYGLNVVDKLGNGTRTRVLPMDVEEARPAVERAWSAIRDQGLEEAVPVDLDMVYLELGRLGQEIDDLERQLAVST